jgi:hypothetical protein
VRTLLFGYIVEECGCKHYKVQFDDGQILAVALNNLRIEIDTDALPPCVCPQPASHAASTGEAEGQARVWNCLRRRKSPKNHLEKLIDAKKCIKK